MQYLLLLWNSYAGYVYHAVSVKSENPEDALKEKPEGFRCFFIFRPTDLTMWSVVDPEIASKLGNNTLVTRIEELE